MGRMTRHRIEIGLALALTLAAFLFVALAVWAEQGTGIDVSETWARPTIGKGRITAAYMKIHNLGTDADTLRGASSPKAARVEIHETEMTDQGVMKMRPLGDGLTLPAGETATLKPGGTHIMVMGLDSALAKGATLPLTLEFEKAGQVELSVPVGTGPSAASDGASTTDGSDHSHH
jgi:copper(I)-binding protein